LFREWTDDDVDRLLGGLLRVGVLLAAMVVLAGGVVYLIRHGSEPAQYGVFHGEPDDYRSPSAILRGAFSFRGRGLIQLGLLLLIATPVARVAFSVAAFAIQRDRMYVAITAVVLFLLLFSLFGARLPV